MDHGPSILKEIYMITSDFRVFSSDNLKISSKVDFSSSKMDQLAKAISSPVPESLYPMLAFIMLSLGLIVTAAFFIYEATTSRKNRSLAKELTTGSVASVFLGFGSLFLLLASGVYV